MGEAVILTSKIGKFEFEDDVLLSHAKVIRDTVVGQWLSPKPGTQILRTLENVDSFMRGHSSRLIAETAFKLIFPDDEEAQKHHLEEADLLEELPQPPLIPVPPIWIRQALTEEQKPEWMRP